MEIRGMLEMGEGMLGIRVEMRRIQRIRVQMRGMRQMRVGMKDTVESTEDLQMAKISNNYFSNVIRSLCDVNFLTEPGIIACSQNSVSKTINKFKYHSSNLSINKNIERIGCMCKFISSNCQL